MAVARRTKAEKHVAEVDSQLADHLRRYAEFSDEAVHKELRFRPEEARKANDHARLSLLQFKFLQRLRLTTLPKSGQFTHPMEYEAAAKLVSTYRDISLLEKKLGLPVTERPELVSQLNSLAMKYYREHGPTRRSQEKDS